LKKHSNNDYEIIDFDATEEVNPYEEKEDYTFDVATEQYGKQHKKDKIIKTALILLSLYMAFLIVGLLSTGFYTNSKNEKEVIFMNYAYIKDKKDYEAYKKQIEKLRDLYVDITILDIKTANGDISYAKAAQEYNSYLDYLDKFIPKVEAMDVQNANELIKTNIVVTLKQNVGHYLIYISDGLVTQDNAKIEQAVSYRDLMFSDYNGIMTLMEDLATNLHLQEDDFFSWDLNEAVIKKDKTAVLKEGNNNEQ